MYCCLKQHFTLIFYASGIDKISIRLTNKKVKNLHGTSKKSGVNKFLASCSLLLSDKKNTYVDISMSLYTSTADTISLALSQYCMLDCSDSYLSPILGTNIQYMP